MDEVLQCADDRKILYNSAAGDLLPGVPHDDGLSELRVRGEADLPRGQELGLDAVHARARHAQDGASREAGAGLRRAKKSVLSPFCFGRLEFEQILRR